MRRPGNGSGPLTMFPLSLAPDGVYPAPAVTGGAVSSYLTVSPLPPFLRTKAVCFLWHFPWPRGLLSLTTILALGVRTFLRGTGVSPRSHGRLPETFYRDEARN